MNTLLNMKLAAALILLMLGIGVCLLYKRCVAQEKVSELGKYQGYSWPIYDGARRTSDYLTLLNGTRLAYDLILPTKKGVPTGGRLPVLFKYTPYLRTFTIFDKNGKNMIADLYDLGWKEKALLRIRYWISDQGRFMDPLFRTKWLKNMVRHGYAVIVVERPGTGASFGRLNPSFEAGAREVNEILNWIAVQDWCDGNIGMYGDSWQGQIQFSAASTGNPHLKAIFPASTWLDNYTGSLYPGGVYNKAFGTFFTWSQRFLNSNVITPVDGDQDGKLLAQARAERGSATVGEKFTEVFREFRFRDSISPEGYKIWLDSMAHPPFMNRVNGARVPTYMVAGWYDLFVRDMLLLYANLSVPKRLLVRPLDHSGIERNQFDLDYGEEAHRWFDYWLKGINNGIMDEPPIHYYLLGSPTKRAWKTADAWPLKNLEMENFYFAMGKDGKTSSIHQGALQPGPPSTSGPSDTYRVDYSTTTGRLSRWTAVNWGHKYPDMRFNDAKAMTYTTAPLESSAKVIGHPVVYVWLRSDVPDLDLFVYLEEVDIDGNSTYVTEGKLRASHRALGRAPFENLGLPWHNHFQSELKEIPSGEPVELMFDLLPTAFEFSKGRRIRLAIAFADADNFDTPVIDPAPGVHLPRDENHPSFLMLPRLRLR
jgi:putative CocE/NonD family hydrolase